MSNSQTQVQQLNNQPQLFHRIYEFQIGQEDLKDFKKVQQNIKQIIFAIKKLQKTNVGEIEKICFDNKKLVIISKMIFNEKISTLIINMFTHLLISPKLLKFINNLSIPLVVFRNLIKLTQREKQEKTFSTKTKDKELEEYFKFIFEYCKVDSKKFPRFYSNFIGDILSKNNKNFTENQSHYPIILDICIQIIRNNLSLSVESEILQNLYNKIIAGEIELEKIKIIVEIIVNYCSIEQTRIVIFSTIDLSKAFIRFNNVQQKNFRQGTQSSNYLRPQQFEENLIKSCTVIEILLSSWSTLTYFITQKWTLTHFINSLVLKTPLQIEIINNEIIQKIIKRALSYNKLRIKKSMNYFGYKSNYLNYRGLALLNFLLEQNLYQTIEKLNKGQTLQSLSRLCLEYFPNIFQNQKYNKKIIRNIKYTKHYQNFIAQQAYKKKMQSSNEQILISIKSFCSYSLISYDFELKEIRNFLIEIKQNDKVIDGFSEELKDQIDVVLKQLKIECYSQNNQNDKTKNDALLASCYYVGIKVSYFIPWRTEYLKFARFLSNILEHLLNNQYTEIYPILIRTMKQILQPATSNVHQYLIVTILDDFGKFLSTNLQCQQMLLRNFQNEDHSFRISRILLSIDFEKSEKYNRLNYLVEVLSPKRLLQEFCNKGGSISLLLQIIEIIKKNYYQNIEKYMHQFNPLVELVSNILIYHKNQEVTASCIQFFEEIASSKCLHFQKYVKSVKLDRIKTQYLGKRAAYLFLMYQSGYQIILEQYPQFFKEQLENWFANNNKILKDYSNFLLKEVRKFNCVSLKQKQTIMYLFLGFQQQERRSLLNLPWNIVIGEQSFPALAQFKMLKQKLKLRVKINRSIQSQISISLMNIGKNSFGKQVKSSPDYSESTIITIRYEQIVKNFERYKNKETKEQKLFAVTKEQVTLFFKKVSDQEEFILERLNINIHLQKNIYRPLIYPHNFIYLLTMTKAGLQFLKKQKIIQKCIDPANLNLNSSENLKCYLIYLGSYSSGIIESTELSNIYDFAIKIFYEIKNYQIKEICHWLLNILMKNYDLKRKMMEQKKWKIVETKYCGTLIFFNYESIQKREQDYNILGYMNRDIIRQITQKIENEPEYRQVYDFLNNEGKQLEMLNTQKLSELKNKNYSNFKVFEGIMKYMSLINYGNEKIHICLQMYKTYISSTKFENDFQNGFILP